MDKGSVKYNGLTVEEIIEAVRIITKNTYIPENHTTTLLGWNRVYDKKGRLVTADPNIKVGTLNIEGTEYVIYRKGWRVAIIKPQYTEKFKNTTYLPDERFLMADFSIEPEYVIEYKRNKEKNNGE